jgi:hypothetical protein
MAIRTEVCGDRLEFVDRIATARSPLREPARLMLLAGPAIDRHSIQRVEHRHQASGVIALSGYASTRRLPAVAADRRREPLPHRVESTSELHDLAHVRDAHDAIGDRRIPRVGGCRGRPHRRQQDAFAE